MSNVKNSKIRIKVSNLRIAVLFWFISFIVFYSLLQMDLRNSFSTSSSDPFPTYMERITKLYDKMEQELQENGPMFLRKGESCQSSSLSDLFTLKDGVISPVLKVASPPVRVNVLHISTEYSVPLSNAIKSVFSPYFKNTIWFQDSKLYHLSMNHASHHDSPVPATEDEVKAEAAAIESVANTLCPLVIILDIVILTSTGVLLGCWNWKVISGDDPMSIRSKLRSALPRAPENQLYYDAEILHTSVARLLGPSKSPNQTEIVDDIQLLHDFITRLNNQIRGFKVCV